ncbi:sodium/hydrogen exchanger 3 [Saprolegnia parasitica CBS 223.65]|uniref:Sodium/hydrogen exchanger n=1 Tax=Saprolegnia parasitica (strain CBS 223.65) TaxID=695850 RepID=A0A067BM96_SAPPC|nr:sodium/hydrogen exchanger 3 [Saprolegnia parasitica CBS 223.65]KDO19599.1 sodium/hydrogen exchanger 3 [Saprolegnia parasitica CBS 223.65]|eukprot:XP_012209695.1 sodium/hydrogen exchanger 3 [Saprolegnia parasitica CBS 223.65]
MEVLLLSFLLILVIGSFFLEGTSQTFISQSGIALLFGVFAGGCLVHLNFNNNVFFEVLLPPIIYEAGFSVKRVHFFSNLGAIMSTAIVGTLIATGVTGGAIYVGGLYGVITPLSWIESFLFGALISAVDPVATLACFEKLNAPPLLFNIVFGESLLNDAVVIALYQTLSKWKPDATFSASGLGSVLGSTLAMLGGSLVVSAAITLAGAFLMNRDLFSRLHLFPAYEISLCLIFSLLTYYAAESLHLSGIVALFFSGILTAHYHFHTLSLPGQQSFRHLLHTFAFVCETLVFVFMGTSLVFVFAGHTDDGMTWHDIDWTFIGFTLGFLLLSRLLNIVPLLAVSNLWRRAHERISPTTMFVIWFAGLRGAISFALVKTWTFVDADGTSHRPLIVSTTLIIVVFTTLVLGGLTGPLLAALGHKPHANAETAPGSPISRPSFSFLQSIDDDAHNTASQLRQRRPAHDALVEPEDGSIAKKVATKWNSVDSRYLQPLFGGQQLVASRVEASIAASGVYSFVETPTGHDRTN